MWKLYHCLTSIFCNYGFFFKNFKWYNSGNRIGWKSHYWRLCHDIACSNKGSVDISFLEDPADNAQSWLRIWEVRSWSLLIKKVLIFWFDSKEDRLWERCDFLDSVWPLSMCWASHLYVVCYINFGSLLICPLRKGWKSCMDKLHIFIEQYPQKNTI